MKGAIGTPKRMGVIFKSREKTRKDTDVIDPKTTRLSKELMFQSHVRLGVQSDTSTEYVRHSRALLCKGVYDWGPGRSARGLQHITEDAEDAMEAFVILGGGTTGHMGFPSDSSHKLSDECEVDD